MRNAWVPTLGLVVCLALPAYGQEEGGVVPPVPEQAKEKTVEDLLQDLQARVGRLYWRGRWGCAWAYAPNTARRDMAERQLEKLTSEVVPELLELFSRPDPDLRERVARLLAAAGDKRAVPKLLQLLDEAESRAMRAKVIELLGRLGAEEAAPPLIGLLGEPWLRISEGARQALVAIGEPAADEVAAAVEAELAKRPGTWQDGVLYRGLLILGEVPCERSREVLLEALRYQLGSEAVAVRHHAAKGLEYQADPATIEPLIEALENEGNFDVQKALSRALSNITGEDRGFQGFRWRAWWVTEGKRKYDGDRGVPDFEPVEVPDSMKVGPDGRLVKPKKDGDE